MFTYHTITHLTDGLLPEWLVLYETAFPAHERVLVAGFLKHLRRIEAGDPVSAEMLAAVDRERRLAGMAFYEHVPDLRLMFLWYMAVDGERRSQGLGSQLYQEVVHRARRAGCRALLFEVERPAVCSTSETQALAERRIQFYRRNGAQLLQGVDYLQSVGPHQPATPMHLMLHPFEPLTSGDAFALAKAAFDDALCQVAELRLV
ncbi:MAG: GNAT family N-acetyltransferase [Chloroflexota bacterium]